MRHLPLGYTVLGLGVLALASCGSDETTAPTKTPTVTGPELAVAHNTWVTRRDIPHEVQWPAIATVSNPAGQAVVYVIGGRGSGQSPNGYSVPDMSLDWVQAYNVATNTWSQKARLPTALYGTNGTGVVNGKIYISGGYYLDEDSQAADPVGGLFQYDPATNIWTRKAYMPESGALGLTGVIKGKLYVVSTCFERVPEEFYYDECGSVEGGRPGISNFFRYNPVTNRWARLPSPKGVYQAGHMGGVLYDKLYLTDGKTIEVYDPVTNQWTMKVTGGQVRVDAAATVQGAMLYLTGGRQPGANGWQPVRSTRVYHPITNTWTTAAPMTTARYGIAAIRVFLDGQPRIEVVGGSPPGNNLQYIP